MITMTLADHTAALSAERAALEALHAAQADLTAIYNEGEAGGRSFWAWLTWNRRFEAAIKRRDEAHATYLRLRGIGCQVEVYKLTTGWSH